LKIEVLKLQRTVFRSNNYPSTVKKIIGRYNNFLQTVLQKFLDYVDVYVARHYRDKHVFDHEREIIKFFFKTMANKSKAEKRRRHGSARWK